MSSVLIHAVALPVLEQLIHHATADKPRDDAEVSIVKEGMRLAEVLVSLAEEHTSTANAAKFFPFLIFHFCASSLVLGVRQAFGM